MTEKKSLLKIAITLGAISLACLIGLIICKVILFNNRAVEGEAGNYVLAIFLTVLAVSLLIIGLLMAFINVLIGVLPMIKEKKFILKQELIILGSTLALMLGYLITYLV